MSDKQLCSHCRFPLPENASGLRHYGLHTAHQESECLRLLQSAIDAQAAEIARLRAACTNARDMLSTDRQAFVDSNRLRDGRTDDPIAYGLNLVDEDTWITAEDAECVRDYDRAIALIDAALTPQQPAPSA